MLEAVKHILYVLVDLFLSSVLPALIIFPFSAHHLFSLSSSPFMLYEIFCVSRLWLCEVKLRLAYSDLSAHPRVDETTITPYYFI